jgi:SPP1 family predicted phage head-tail adaptor
MIAPTHLFDTTASVQRVTITVDTSGAPIFTYTTSIASINCRLNTLSGDEAMRYGRHNTRYTHAVYAANGLDINEKDRVIIAGKTLEIDDIVVFYDNAAGVYVRLDCIETKPA